MRQSFSFYNIIILIEFLCSILPIYSGFIRYRHLLSQTFGIWILVIVSFIFSIISKILWIYSINNLYLLHFYTLLELIIISLIYNIEFKGFLPKYLIEGIIIIFVLFSTINFFLIQGFISLNSYQRIIECIVLIIFSLLFFYKTAQELKVKELSKEPMFWFSVGVLLYFSGGLFIFIFSNFLLNFSKELRVSIWTIYTFFLIMFYFFTTIALWVSNKKSSLHG